MGETRPPEILSIHLTHASLSPSLFPPQSVPNAAAAALELDVLAALDWKLGPYFNTAAAE